MEGIFAVCFLLKVNDKFNRIHDLFSRERRSILYIVSEQEIWPKFHVLCKNSKPVEAESLVNRTSESTRCTHYAYYVWHN